MLQHSEEHWPTWTTKGSVIASNVAARSGSNGSSLYRRRVVALGALADRSAPERPGLGRDYLVSRLGRSVRLIRHCAADYWAPMSSASSKRAKV